MRRGGWLALWLLFPLTASTAGVVPAEPATGLDRSGMSPAIRPQDDLFGAMNGAWLDHTPFPPDKAEYGLINQLRDKSDERVRNLIEEASAGKSPADSALGKAATFYRAYLDTEAIERAGFSALSDWLHQIDAVDDQAKIAQWVGRGNVRHAVRAAGRPGLQASGSLRTDDLAERTWPAEPRLLPEG